MGWVSHFNNSDWSASSGSWDGSEWDTTGAQILLLELGIWVEGYRPTKVRLTHNLNVAKDCGMSVRNSSGTVTYGSSSDYASGAEISLAYSPDGDIGRLYVQNNTDTTDFSVQNIEFFGLTNKFMRVATSSISKILKTLKSTIAKVIRT